MKKTIVYIDGYNLYYGLLKGAPGSKWLNLRALAAAMFKEEHDILSVKYFTARVRTYPQDIAAEERQKIYLQALAAFGGDRPFADPPPSGSRSAETAATSAKSSS